MIDLMPVMREEEKHSRLTPFRQLLRCIECIEGEIAIDVEYVPRPDYARAIPRLEERDGVIIAIDGPTILHLRSDVAFDIDRDQARTHFTLKKGERRDFALAFDSHSPAVLPHLGDKASEEINETLAFWKEWGSQLEYDGQYRDEVLRSVSVSLSIRPHPADRTRRGFAGAYPVPASTRAWLSANSIEPPVSSSASGAGSNPGSSAGSSPKRSRET